MQASYSSTLDLYPSPNLHEKIIPHPPKKKKQLIRMDVKGRLVVALHVERWVWWYRSLRTSVFGVYRGEAWYPSWGALKIGAHPGPKSSKRKCDSKKEKHWFFKGRSVSL